jgi:hypothetical protein
LPDNIYILNGEDIDLKKRIKEKTEMDEDRMIRRLKF